MVKNNPFVKSVKMYSMLLLREKIHNSNNHYDNLPLKMTKMTEILR